MDYVLEVRNITKRFGGLVAVNNVSMGVRAGEVVGLLGDNGAGKSTLIKVISGVYRADEGTVLFQGREVQIGSPMDALAMGIETIYQDLALAENLNVYSNIFMGREITGALGRIQVKKQRQETMSLMRAMGFTSKLLHSDSIVMNCSGGEREGIAIARAMYFRANLVILDEPTTALSVTETDKVLNFVSKIKEKGGACIVIMHNIYHAYKIAERFVIMDRGKVVEEIGKAAVSSEQLIERMSLIANEGRVETDA